MKVETPENQKAIYVKHSSQGKGYIPVRTEGTVLLIVQSGSSKKLLIDFGEFGKAIVPLSCVTLL